MTGKATSVGFNSARKREQGQTTVLVLLALGVFLLATVALAVDFTHLWVRHQLAQTAADSACIAGVMDMLALTGNAPVTTTHLDPPNAFTCSNTNVALPANYKTPCWYAAANGYTSPGLTADTPSNVVSGSWPDVSACPSGSGCPVPGVNPITGGALPTAWATRPVLEINVTDRAPVSFLRLFGGSATRDVKTGALCGLVAGESPSPITVLSPDALKALEFAGNGTTIISGGPKRSIQVNSNNTSSTPAMFGSGSCDVDASLGGPSLNGGTVAITGTASSGSATCNFDTHCPTCPFVTGAAPIADPFKTLAAPSNTGMVNGGFMNVGPGVNGCPDNGGCKKYSPGYYNSDIVAQGSGTNTETLIFEPGVYYMNGKLSVRGNSCLRPADPATAPGDGSKGVIFYFASTNNSLDLSSSGAGDCSFSSPEVISAFNATDSRCVASGVGTSALPPGIPSSFTGSVLLGPCNLPTMEPCTPNCGINYGDPQGTGNPIGVQRGVLFFQSRTATLNVSSMPSWQGGGNFFIAGHLYFHHNAFSHAFTFAANGSPGYFNGAIVSDMFKVGGSANLTMYLSPNFGYVTLKASLFR